MPKPKPAASLQPGMAIEMWPADRPIDYPKNARKWPVQAIAKVAASIREYGFRQPIVVDREGVIVIGHLRRRAAQSLGLAEVPVHVASDLSPKQIKGLRLMDNRSNQESSWDKDLLGPAMMELKSLDFDLKLIGFGKDEINSLFVFEDGWPESGRDADTEKPESAKPAAGGGYKEQYGVIVICTGEEHQEEIFTKLTADGFTCRIVVT